MVCNLCETANPSPLHERLRRITGYSMSRCTACGLVFQSPRPPVAVDTEYYRSRYYESDHKAKEHVSRLALFKAYLRRLERFAAKGRILDIGCGPAHFLRYARDQGYDVRGVEVSRKAVKEAERHLPGRVMLASFDEADLPRDAFDAITLFNVLDQLPDPLQTVRKVHALLRPGGVLLARVPNGAVHHRLKALLDRFDGLTERYGLSDLTPFHLYQFTPATLGALYRKAGFAAVRLDNAPVSRGDPSGRSRGAALLALSVLKRSGAAAAWIVKAVSAGALLVGSSLDGYAFKHD